jgi:glycine cleavage system aminomethyltransferase T
MLREDGHVMDDGTTARMGEHHFVMTTTTAAAGQVMTHLEFVHQCLRPDLDVAMISTTEQWAQFSVAGPKARDLRQFGARRADRQRELSLHGLRRRSRSTGVKGRLFRISFSGEHAYEIAVPARYGEALFRDLVARAETLGGGAYGMEALNVLRVEKGFITHSEIHGRVTADDIGMGRMVSTKKDCIGKTASERPGCWRTTANNWWGCAQWARSRSWWPAGISLHPGGRRSGHGSTIQGYITSVAWSPTLGTYIGRWGSC